MPRKYTWEQLTFLRDGFQTMTVPQLTKAFNEEYGLNKSEMAVHSLLGYYKFTTKRRINSGTYFRGKRYTEEQKAFLKEGYKSMSIQTLTAAFNSEFGENRTEISIQGALRTHNLHTERKPGMLSTLEKEIGAERLCPNTGFLMVKVAKSSPYRAGPTSQIRKHTAVWEEANGPVPEGYCLRFLDGDKTNCSMENLSLFNRTESLFMSLMKHDSAPPELRETIRLTAKLKAKVAERKRELMEGENA